MVKIHVAAGVLGELFKGFLTLQRCGAAGFILSATLSLAAGRAVAAAPAHTAADVAHIKHLLISELLERDVDSVVVHKWLAAAKPDGSFGDIDYADTRVNDGWQPQQHLERLKALTTAYAGKNKPLSGDEKCKAAVLKGVEFWLDKDFQNKNWFWNQIGVPGRLAPVLLVFWADLPAAQQAKALAILGRAKVAGSGANLVWLAQVEIQRGILAGDASAVAKAYAAIAADIHANTKQSDGPQADNSFLYHGPLLYSWGYGISYLRDQAHIMAQAAGTSFAFPPEKISLVRGWTLDGAQWMTRGNGVDFGAVGRSVSRKDQNSAVLQTIARDLLTLSLGRDDELKGMAARQGGDFATPLNGNHAFWRADMMCQQRPGWYASARMYSARTRNTEWGNGEALRSFYLADGATVLMRDGKEYFDISPVWDWQHVPGTTVEMLPGFGPVDGKADGAADGFNPNRNRIVNPSKETFVGGASDGHYGVFGGKFSRGALAVQRGWFFFDDQFVCLGAGLSCATDNPVHTTLDQCFLRGPVTAAAASPLDLPAGEHDISELRWLLHDGVGYLFAAPVHAQVDNHPQRGSWHDISTAYPADEISKDVFKAYIIHDAKPADVAYAYTVFPRTDAASLAAAADKPPVLIASNTALCQAVWQSALARGGAIFYAAGNVELRPGLKITVDQPVMLLVAPSAGGAAVSISNPENKALAVHVKVEVDDKSAEADFKLPGDDSAGSTVTQTLTY